MSPLFRQVQPAGGNSVCIPNELPVLLEEAEGFGSALAQLA